MNLEEYWNMNTALLNDEKPSCPETIQIRKIIICRFLDIPVTEISYYLSNYEYLKRFALEDAQGLSDIYPCDETILSKVDSEIQRIYSRDYKKLKDVIIEYNVQCNGLKNESNTRIAKEDVEKLIKLLIRLINMNRLSEDIRKTIEVYNEVYCCQTRLLNLYIKEKYNDSPTEYYEHLLLQWQTANDLAAQVSQQRSSMNNFYMSLMSILIAGILFGDNMIADLSIPARSIIYITVLIVGIFLCHIWRRQIENYAKLNLIKYQIINEIEQSLPANIMHYEYKLSEKNLHNGHRKINFSMHEKAITVLFEVTIILIPLILLLFSLGYIGSSTAVTP